MAGNTSAPAVADKHDLIAAIVTCMRRCARSFKTLRDRKWCTRAIGDLGIADQLSQRFEIDVNCFLHANPARTLNSRPHLSNALILLTKVAFSIGLRWPTISTARAPTT